MNLVKIPIRVTNYVKSVRIRSYSGPHFPAFWLNTERYSVSLRIQPKYGKIWTRITLHMDTFYAVTAEERFQTQNKHNLIVENNTYT